MNTVNTLLHLEIGPTMIEALVVWSRLAPTWRRAMATVRHLCTRLPHVSAGADTTPP